MLLILSILPIPSILLQVCEFVSLPPLNLAESLRCPLACLPAGLHACHLLTLALGVGCTPPPAEIGHGWPGT
ncbi:hypothetical protein IF1G_09570 [Cordyceps javanica]|uniref:Secreted protein n=1 Tax=Cordyceps javanica TaxID=43265 RepID=A0A545UR96_9HYPO|nr:hypothetical protein IF1G_09570 [Cordyceps javanica]TQW03932.1 hypothetical protein IF2G_08761 [Cordyceps javanica]